jgi:hypothetical protein
VPISEIRGFLLGCGRRPRKDFPHRRELLGKQRSKKGRPKAAPAETIVGCNTPWRECLVLPDHLPIVAAAEPLVNSHVHQIGVADGGVHVGRVGMDVLADELHAAVTEHEVSAAGMLAGKPLLAFVLNGSVGWKGHPSRAGLLTLGYRIQSRWGMRTGKSRAKPPIRSCSSSRILTNTLRPPGRRRAERCHRPIPSRNRSYSRRNSPLW